MTEKQYVTHDIVKFDYSEIWRKSDDEMHTDTPLRNDEVVDLLNEMATNCNQLKNDNEQLKQEVGYYKTLLQSLKEQAERISQNKVMPNDRI